MYVKVVVGKPVGLKDRPVAYMILGQWEVPTAVNDPKYGQEQPGDPKPVVKPKLKLT